MPTTNRGSFPQPPPPRDFERDPPTALDMFVFMICVASLVVLDSAIRGRIQMYDAFKMYFLISVCASFVAFLNYAKTNGVVIQSFDQVCALNGLAMLALWTADMAYPALIEGTVFAAFMTFGYRRVLVEMVSRGFDVRYLVTDYDAMLESRKKFAWALYMKWTTVVWPVVRQVFVNHWFHFLIVWFFVQLVWHYQTELIDIVSEMFQLIKSVVNRAFAWLGPYADQLRQIVVDAIESVRRVAVDILNTVYRSFIDLIEFVRTAFARVVREGWAAFVRCMHWVWDVTAAMREFMGRMWIQFKHLLQYVWNAVEWLAQKLWLLLNELVHPSIQTMGAAMLVLIAECVRRRYTV